MTIHRKGPIVYGHLITYVMSILQLRVQRRLEFTQPFLLYHVNNVVLMLTSIFFLHDFHKKMKARSTLASSSLGG